MKESDKPEYDRRIHLRFDLSNVTTADAERATLQLTATPSGIGFVSRTPDSTFSVYGVTDDALDD